jgi:hypothetical protein
LAVGSVVWFVLNLALGLLAVDHQVDRFQRVPLPGQGEVSFTEPGGYVLYYEGLGAPEVAIPPFTASLMPGSGDASIPISDYGGSLTYDFSGHSGQAVGTFNIDTPGRFLLRTESEVDGVGQATVAVGQSVGGGIVRTVVLALVGAPVLFLGGAALAVVVAIRRRRAQRLSPTGRVEVWAGASGGGSGARLADPSKRHELRYWDGEAWTEHVSDGGTRTVDPVSQPRPANPEWPRR